MLLLNMSLFSFVVESDSILDLLKIILYSDILTLDIVIKFCANLNLY